MKDSDWSDDLDEIIEVVDSVSPQIDEQAKNLFREDHQSLKVYLGSQSFFEDLMAEDSSVRLSPEILFFIMYEQFKRKLRDESSFQKLMIENMKENGADQISSEVSPEFFEDQSLIQYLVTMLKRFVKTNDVYKLPVNDDKRYKYVFEMLEASRDSSDTESFQIFLHIGNYSLFLTGLFPEWIRYRHEHKNRPMDIDSYRKYGKTFFDRASNHRLARRRKLEPVLSKLSKGYDFVRSSVELIFRRMLPAF